MPPTKVANLSTNIPTWLIVVMVAALTLRIGVKTWDKNHPPSSRSGIEWHDVNTLDKLTASKSSKKLLLIDFTAEWCRPCREMEKTTFLNRTVTEIANRDYDAIKVIDRESEEDKNPKNISDLQTQYSIYGFPTIVIALPDMSLVEKQSGYKTPKEFAEILAAALRKADFVRAKVAMYDCKFEDALTCLGDRDKIEFQKLGSIQSSSMVYWHILSSLHKDEEAKKVVSSAENYVRKNSKVENDDEWPIPLFRYMVGELTDKQLMAKATTKYEQTDAHLCLGLKKLQMGDKEHAIKEFTTTLRTGYTYGDSYALVQKYLDKLCPEEAGASDR